MDELILPKIINISTTLDTLLSQINLMKNKKINLSFEEMDSINPESVILLISLSKYIYDQSNVRVVWKNTKDMVYKTLRMMNITNIPFILLDRIPLRLFIH